MSTAVVSAYRVATTPQYGGHFWVYMQYAHALRQLGFEVFWLEQIEADAQRRNPTAVGTFLRRMARFGFARRVILYGDAAADGRLNFSGMSSAEAEGVFARADFLLNFHYGADERLLSRFDRTVMVDVDPGLLQWWISRRQIRVAPHDLYLTTGESVGRDGSSIDDCGLSWIHIRPPVCLDLWPYVYDSRCRRFTTVSSWLGGEYVTDRGRVLYRNDKSVSFLKFAQLPSRTGSELELAIYLKGREDGADRALLQQNGWRVRDAREVSGTPEGYRAYIQASRGEFSCAKPSCLAFQNSWVSDRTLCYLSSGKPVVVQDSGPSSFLPSGEGMFRFTTLDQAAAALAAIDGDYRHHCDAARAIAETHFDARSVVANIAQMATGPRHRGDAAPRSRGVQETYR